MEDQEKKPAEDQREPVQLTAEFYQKLLGVPPCKRGEPCNHCGKCEH